jgi:hypothetical protein
MSAIWRRCRAYFRTTRRRSCATGPKAANSLRRGGVTRLGPRRQRLTRKEWTEQQRQAKSLANARASLMADIETAKAQAKQVIDGRIAKTRAAAQARVNDVTMQMHQRIEAMKQKAGRRISEERAMVVKLESELVAKDDRLQAALALLEEHGIGFSKSF